MVTFMGHWPDSFEVPGTGYYVGLPVTGGHAHEASDGEGHTSHCHGDSASCSNSTPSTAGVTFGLMSEAIALALASGALVAVATFARAALRENVLSPETRPPRLVLLSS